MAALMTMAGSRCEPRPQRQPVPDRACGPDGSTIGRDIFGQFAEHLGQGIYGGVWVGKKSKIPNIRGIRTDVVSALRAIRVRTSLARRMLCHQYHCATASVPPGTRIERQCQLGGTLEPNSFAPTSS